MVAVEEVKEEEEAMVEEEPIVKIEPTTVEVRKYVREFENEYNVYRSLGNGNRR